MTCKNKKCAIELADHAKFCSECGRNQQEKKRNTKSRPNGTGSVYYVDGKGYVAEFVKYYYTDENGKRKKKTAKKTGFKTKREALNYLPLLSNKKEKKTPTLNELWEVYENSKLDKLSESKQTAYKIAKKRLESIFYVPITSLTIGDLQSVINEKAETYHTRKDMKMVLSHLYKMAAAQDDVKSNLATFIELPKHEESDPVPFTKEEQNAFWKLYAEKDDFVSYVLLMIYTGTMPGELLKMQKDCIDLENQRIIGAGIKTKKRKETPIVLPDVIIPVVERILEQSDTDKLVNYRKHKFYDEYYKCLERANVDKKPPYSCRHTTGTALGTSETPIPLWIMKEIMRHTKISTTQKYVHPDTDIILDAANKI